MKQRCDLKHFLHPVKTESCKIWFTPHSVESMGNFRLLHTLHHVCVFFFFLTCFADWLSGQHLMTRSCYNLSSPSLSKPSSLLTCFFLWLQEAPSSQDILVFLTGQEEIEAMTKTCRDIAKHLPDGCPQMMVIPLYASLPYSQQHRIFRAAPKVRGCDG